MNQYLFVAGLISLMAVAGHFAVGIKLFLRPIMKSNIDQVPKKVMQSLFHYMSVFMILSTIVLIVSSFGKCVLFNNSVYVLKFIGISYASFAVVMLIIALTSPIKGATFKLFQWVFWALIAVFTLMGIA